MMPNSDIDILMSVYRGTSALQLQRCLNSLSLLNGTFRRLVLVFDGPILQDVSDQVDYFSQLFPIKTVKLSVNVGLGSALNHGLRHCSSKYIARQDCDDISVNNRFQRQYEFMERHPDVSASSCGIIYTSSLNQTILVRRCPSEMHNIKSFSTYSSPLNHASCILRAQHLKEIGGYPEFRRSQDYALWELFLSKGYKLANQDFVGYQVFWDPVSFKRVGFSSLDQEFRVLAYRYSINWNLNFKHVCIYVLKRYLIALMPYSFLRIIRSSCLSSNSLISSFAALILLVLLSPVLVLLISLSAYTHKSIGVFVQKRVGNKGRYFSCFKIQTMKNADSSCSLSSASNCTVTNSSNPRITRFGSFLRRFKLDELPQLLNIILGDIGFVGFRPDVYSSFELLPGDVLYSIFTCSAGVTSIASLLFYDEEFFLDKVEDKYCVSIALLQVKASLSIWYEEYRSFSLDLLVCFATVLPFLRPYAFSVYFERHRNFSDKSLVDCSSLSDIDYSLLLSYIASRGDFLGSKFSFVR